MSSERPVADAPRDRPSGWEAPGAALVRSAATDEIPALAELGRVHIMGIAGAGMSGLARILLERGIPVSGCEARESLGIAGLRALGAQVSVGHSTAHLADADTLVYTTAINPGQEELARARSSGMRVLRRAAALAAALEDRRCIAIAGTHGKTSATSLLTVGAQACGVDPSFAIGGNLYESGKNAHLGSGGPGSLAIVEVDESDGSFLLCRPWSALITNVEADHLENHGDLEGVFAAFEAFVDRIDRHGGPPASPTGGTPARGGVAGGGLLLWCADDPGARRVAEYARARGRRVRSYGESEGADVRVSEIRTLADAVEFTVVGPGLPGRRVRVAALVGRHMALNAAAALAMAVELGLDPQRVADSWSRFGGVSRRFEPHGTGGGVRVYDDYAHHPTEIAASLAAARVTAGEGRLIAVFQPGTYSRTQTFAQEFADALALADAAVVLDIFPAREEPIPGVTGASITDLIRVPAEHVVYEPRFAAVPGRVAELARPGDLVLTMGIGNVYMLCEPIREACARAHGSPPASGEAS